MTHGLLAGRFLPPHDGHVFLAETARTLVDALTILVCARPDDAVPVERRVRWMQTLVPDAVVIAHHGPRNWRDEGEGVQADWPAMLARVIGRPVDMVFGAGLPDAPLARVLGARFVPIDPDRAAVPVASAAVRADPWAHWDNLPRPVRGHYAKRICLHGPESTGKSTLCPRLAAHFGTLFVPEYGRTYCDQHGLDLSMDDLVAIGRTHAAMTEASSGLCNQRLFLDTDPLMTAAWADMLFGRRDPWFDAFTGTADLYLLLDIDLPWVDDGTRFFGDAERRRRFFDLSRAELERRGLPYVVVGGRLEERFDRALDAIRAAGLG